MGEWQALVGGTLIDGSGQAPIPDAAVVFEGERNRYAGARAGAEWPAGTAVRRVDGLTILPGLIDCHDHLAHPGLDLARIVTMPPSLLVYETAQSLAQTLRAGITTVRDAGWLDYGAKLAVERGIVSGPRLVVSINLLCPTAGQGDPRFFSGHSFPTAPGIPNGVRNGVEDCRLGVREMVAAGADAIKIATTGGVAGTWRTAVERQFTDAEIAALVNEAHLWGKRVLCHAYGGPGARAAVKAGTDSVDHGSFLHQDDDILREMADRGTFLVPTLSVIEDHTRLGNPNHRRRAEGIMEQSRRTIERAAALGVRMAMGTDAGAYGHARNARELRLLVEAGLTPMQAIVMSTASAAACIGLEADLGSLEPGKYADLLVVDGNPLTEIAVLEDKVRLRCVMQGGRAIVDRLAVEPIAAA